MRGSLRRRSERALRLRHLVAHALDLVVAEALAEQLLHDLVRLLLAQELSARQTTAQYSPLITRTTRCRAQVRTSMLSGTSVMSIVVDTIHTHRFEKAHDCSAKTNNGQSS